MVAVPKGVSPLTTVTLSDNDMRAATPVLGPGQWSNMAQVQLWLAGKGAQLMTRGPSTEAIGSGGGILGIPFFCKPHKQCLNWLWIVSLHRLTEGAQAKGTFTGAQGTDLGDWVLDPNLQPYQPQHFMFVETFATMTVSYSSVSTVQVQNDGTGDVALSGVQIVELPMANVSTFGSAATPVVNPSTCAFHAPIFEPASGRKSIDGMGQVVNNIAAGTGLPVEGRRPFLFGWSCPNGVATTSAVYESVFSTPAAVVARGLYTVTTATVTVAVLAYTIGAPNTGSIRVTAATGGVCSIDVTATTPTWYEGTLTVETEDLDENSTDGGLRGNTRETLTYEQKVTGGTTSMTFYASFVNEGE